METIIVNVPGKDKNLFLSLIKKLKFKSRVLSEEEKEDMAIAKWIDAGMKTKEVNEEIVFATLKKHGVKI